MRQKFIEGTNKQYSIREDGTVISHWRNRYIKGKYYTINKDVIMKSSLQKGLLKVRLKFIDIFRTVSVAKLVCEHFGNAENHNHSNVIKYIDGNHANCHINNLKIEFRAKEYTGKDRPLTKVEINQRYLNTDKGKEWFSNYKKPKTEKYYRTQRKGQKRFISKIGKSYAAACMGLTVDQMPDDLYELYKANLKLKRLIKSKKNENESSKLPTAHACTV